MMRNREHTIAAAVRKESGAVVRVVGVVEVAGRHPAAEGRLGMGPEHGKVELTCVANDQGPFVRDQLGAQTHREQRQEGSKREEVPRLSVERHVDPEAVEDQTEGREVRGPTDHGFIRSIYLRDPNGYVIELTAKTPEHDALMDPAKTRPHEVLRRWQAGKEESGN